MTSEHSTPDSSAPGDVFATTHWTVVLAAGKCSTPQSDLALEQLCRAYWFPLYAYVRRRGHTKEDAEDLTQAFFARFLARNYLAGLSAERGRFRAFLLASLKHFLTNEWKKSQRLKTRRRRNAAFAGLADGGHEISSRRHQRAESGQGVRPRMGAGTAGQGHRTTAKRMRSGRQSEVVRAVENLPHHRQG